MISSLVKSSLNGSKFHSRFNSAGFWRRQRDRIQLLQETLQCLRHSCSPTSGNRSVRFKQRKPNICPLHWNECQAIHSLEVPWFSEPQNMTTNTTSSTSDCLPGLLTTSGSVASMLDTEPTISRSTATSVSTSLEQTDRNTDKMNTEYEQTSESFCGTNAEHRWDFILHQQTLVVEGQ